MRSFQVTEFGKPLELKEHENPVPKGTEVLIRIIACGVCHSDLHLAEGFFDLGNGKKSNRRFKKKCAADGIYVDLDIFTQNVSKFTFSTF